MQARVREHLQPGETLGAAIWVSRADERPAGTLTRSELSPFRFRRPAPGGPGARRGVNGLPRSLAVTLDEHIRLVTEPRILARTDRRLLVLSERLFRRGSGPLRLRWECPRAGLASAAGEGGRLRLTFTDGSGVTLLTPAADAEPFLAG